MRYALYFTLPPGSPLDRFGSTAVGYDAATGEDLPFSVCPAIGPKRTREATAEPRRYGFHATLKAPMRLRDGLGEDDLVAAVEAFAATRPPVAVGRLRPRAIGRFLALVPEMSSPDLLLFAAECVAAFDHFRAPLAPTDRARRIASGLSERQTALLDRWGYPYVFECFRFHMTLTGPLADEGERATWLAALQDAFAGLSGEAVTIDAVSLLRQDSPDARFGLLARVPLQGQA